MPSDETKVKICIIDDEKDICELLQLYLEDSFDVSIFFDSELAAQSFAHSSYELILSDLKMPNLNGLDIIRAAKKALPDTPVIIVSGQDNGSPELLEAKALGAAQIIKKPFIGLADLADIITKTIAESKNKP